MPDVPSPPPDRPPPRDLPVRWRGTAWSAAAATLSALLWAAAAHAPARTEAWYSTSVFPFVARMLVAMSGWLPFSLGEALLLAAIATALGLGGRGAFHVWRRRRRLGNVLLRGGVRTVGAAALVFTAFVLLWGLNHARPTFAELTGMRPQPVTRSNLLHTLDRLVQRAVAARPADFDVEAPLPNGWQQWIGDAYDLAGADCALLRGPRPPLRTPWLSPLMTLASTTGIYSPFTGEAHVNGELVGIERLFTACHEVAHLRGFAREDEANFIAWRVGSHAAERRVAYACEVQALRHVRGALRDFPGIDDVDALRLLVRAPAVLHDIDAIERFWTRASKRALHGTVTAIAQTTNDLYLKSSGHADGTRSYGRMVDLLVAALAE